MAGKGYSTQQQLLSNKHLKEWNDTTTAETEAFYQLQCKHKIERDQLAFDKITDTHQRSLLITQQSKEVGELKQQHSQKRDLIRECHLKEESALKRKLVEFTTHN
ncbi:MULTISPECIES: hypothetical protein [Spirosoma]|uniref:Uncharacterized protein n=1 Tax=Spirosoma liriopis TaxID=2937440 RepID=A0ABT0HTP3_9BACT|nr:MULTISPECIES: hypothetical protein [Spirosoma]MCK8495526.1 hypothetical protein [Spirosoma liriopis]UHG94538.1 hypothetical protein LQ777_28535 [Spirosoma oryzicola]